MDVHEVVGQLRRALAEARAMPMSATVMVNRTELLALIDQLEAALPHSSGSAADGHGEASPAARAELERLVSETDVVRAARKQADTLLDEARTDALELRRETDDYVDTKLANLQITLTKTLEALNRGRERLHDRSELGILAADPEEDLRIPSDP